MTDQKNSIHHPKKIAQTLNTCLFEQPCQSIVKTLLKLEHLIHAFNKHTQTYDVPRTVDQLMCLMRMLSRANMKAEITKHMHQQHRHLLNFKDHPQVDRTTLDQTLHALEAHLSHLENTQSLLDTKLSDHALLKTLQTNWLHDGVLTHHCHHAFHAWCAQPYATCQPTLQAWGASLRSISAIVTILLQLIRQSGKFQDVACHNTTFIQSLSSNLNMAMVRIRIHEADDIIPEISANRHQIVIQFKKSTVHGHSMTQETCAVKTFSYAYCHGP